MDSRDGKRQGLPWEAALDMLFLAELSMAKRALVAAEMTGMPFSQMYEMCVSQSQISGPDPWADPVINREVTAWGEGRTVPSPRE